MEVNKLKKNPSPDRDDMELKKHLNASFEMDNLTVSEDLIQRTLLKIKESSEEEKTGDNIRDNERKEVPGKRGNIIPFRRYAGAAAAILLLLTAAWIYRHGMAGEKQDNGSVADNQAKYGYDMAAGTGEASSLTDSGTPEQAKQEAPMDIASASSESTEGGEESDQLFTAKESATEDKNQATLKAQDTLPGLYSVEAAEVKSFFAEVKGKEGSAADTEKVTEFYSLLKDYPVKVSDTKESDIKASEEWLYGFDITTGDEKLLTYRFYPDNRVTVTDGRTDGQNVTYTIDQGEELLEKLGDFIAK